MAATSTAQAESTAITEIERLGFKWTEVAQYDLTRVSVEQRVQVREPRHYAPKESVERYAIQMAHSVFPPIVVTADDWIVDGNTRVGAALRRDTKFFPAIVLGIAWGGASTKQRDELYALAATLNAQNGVPLTARETREVTARFVALGWKAEQIGRAIGVRASGVTAVKKEIDAATKLRHVGLDPNGSLNGASLRALGTKEALGLNDLPYKELAKIAADAGLNASEIVTAAKEARAAGSDTGAAEVLTALRTEMGDRIREQSLTGHAKPPVSRQLRQHLGFVTKFAGREQELIETDPKVSPTHLETLENAVRVLTAVIGMQR
jgi:hypothetical protein